jgi:hypothetical protein
MPDNDDSSVFGGSVDRSKLEDMKAAAGDDPVRQAQVAEVQAQVDAVAESDAAAEKAREDALAAQNPQQADEQSADESAAPEPAAEPVTVTESGAPPRAGAGSGRDVWAAYAESRGVEVTEDMTRDEIIEAVEE